MSTRTVETEVMDEVEVDGIAYDVEFSASATLIYRPAKVSGPPEDCYPDESEIQNIEIKITAVWDEAGNLVPQSDALDAAIKAAIDRDYVEKILWEEFDPHADEYEE